VRAWNRSPPDAGSHDTGTSIGTRTAARRSATRRCSENTHRTIRCSM